MLDYILEEFKGLFQEHFPEFKDWRSGSDGTKSFISLRDQPIYYQKTPYYYSDELKFIHWTTINHLSSIINSGEFRLYNLVNSEDAEEFTFATKILNLDVKQTAFIKDNYFTFSFCKKTDLYNEYLWKSYGREFSGVAIEFSIINNINDWENHLISKVYYDQNDRFKTFKAKVEQLQSKYQNQIELEFDIWKLAGFHKKNSFESENEVRISTCFPLKSQEDILKSAKREFRMGGRGNRIVRYIPLKLWIDFLSPYPKDFYPETEYEKLITSILSGQPHIRIDKIYFGDKCGLNQDEYADFRTNLHEMISFQLGYKVEIPLNLFDINNPSNQEY